MALSEYTNEFRRVDLTEMEPGRLLEEARAGRLTVFAQGDRLIVRGPRSAEYDLVQALLRRKAELMPLLIAHELVLWEWFEERAAILEHDGGLPRAQAERQAWAEIYGRQRANDLDIGNHP